MRRKKVSEVRSQAAIEHAKRIYPGLDLPRQMPDGHTIHRHPLIWAMQNHRRAYNDNKSELARRLGVDPRTIYKWERLCREDRNFPLPILRAQQLAEIFDLPPAFFRPDVWSN